MLMTAEQVIEALAKAKMAQDAADSSIVVADEDIEKAGEDLEMVRTLNLNLPHMNIHQ